MAQVRENFLFNPTSISGCATWLDASDRSSFTFSPGTSNVATLTDKATRTAYSIGGTPVWSPTGFAAPTGLNYPAFDMTNGRFLLALTQSFTRFKHTAFLVTKLNSYPTSAGSPCVTLANSVTGSVILDWYRELDYYFSPAQFRTIALSWNTIAATTSPTLNPLMLSSMFNGAGLNPEIKTINSWIATGGSQTAFTASDIDGEFSSDTAAVMIGSDGGSTNYTVPTWPGNIAEVIIYGNVNLSDNDRQQVEGYLAWKWGLQGSLPSNHPFKTAPPLARLPFLTIGIPPVPIPTTPNAVFTSRSVSGCQLWLDGTDPNGNGSIPANGTSISRWVDKSGNQRNAVLQNTFTAATVAAGPTSSTRTLLFNGLSSYLITYANFPNTAYTIFTVQYNTNNTNFGGNSGYMRVLNASPNAYLFVGTYLGSLAGFTGSGAAWNDTSATATTNYLTWRIFETVVSGTTLNLYAEGNNISTKTGTTGTFSDLIVGAASGGGQAWYGNTGEILIYSSALTDAQRQIVEGYLAWKWGLQANLPTSNPYRNIPIAPFSYQPTPFNGSLNIWLPTKISGGVTGFWLDGQDPNNTGVQPATGASITTWTDKSGLNRSFTASGTACIYNASPRGLLFTSNLYTSTYSAVPTSETMFVVARYTANGFFIGSSAAGGREIGTYSSTQIGIAAATIAWGAFTDVGTATTGVDYIITAFVSGSTTQIGLNGAITLNSAGTATMSGAGTTQLGGELASAFRVAGVISEVIAYTSVLTTAQRQQVEGYLAWKWGLQGSLPTAHPFKLFPPPPV